MALKVRGNEVSCVWYEKALKSGSMVTNRAQIASKIYVVLMGVADDLIAM